MFWNGKDYPSANKNSHGHLRVFTQERNHENDKKFLQKVFERIDEDGAALQGDLSSDRTLVVGVFECACSKYQLALCDLNVTQWWPV